MDYVDTKCALDSVFDDRPVVHSSLKQRADLATTMTQLFALIAQNVLAIKFFRLESRRGPIS